MTVDPSKVVLLVDDDRMSFIVGCTRESFVIPEAFQGKQAGTTTVFTGGVLPFPLERHEILLPQPVDVWDDPTPLEWPPKKPAREMAYLQLRNKRGRRY